MGNSSKLDISLDESSTMSRQFEVTDLAGRKLRMRFGGAELVLYSGLAELTLNSTSNCLQ